MNFESREIDFASTPHTTVIAEVGVNHNGDPEVAKQMIAVAARAGADIVKFQAFRTEQEISKFAPKAPYQQETTSAEGSQLEMCKALELSGPALRDIKQHCARVGMPFLCTAFDFDSVDLLVDDLKVTSLKIASSEITNLPFLRYIGAKKAAAVLSTGGSTLAEVGTAIAALTDAGCPELLLLHCVSEYPAPHDQINLRAMQTMREAFGLPVGFSDHTNGINVAIAAAALGAAAVEKHFTLDRTLPGPDHRASVEPDELAALVAGVRAARAALGTPLKRPAPCELANLPLIRKSLVAVGNLPRGTRLTRAMLGIKRPQGGIEPADLDKAIGRTLKRDVEDDAPVRWDDLA